MLHLNILPHEEHWRTFLRNLKFVVVDGMRAPTTDSRRNPKTEA